MNNIEYDCYIKGVFCNPKCNDKKVYLVSNNLTRRAEADYLGNGSAKIEDDETGATIIVWEKRFENKQIKCNFACSHCAKYIYDNSYLQDVLFPGEDDDVILNCKSHYLMLEIDDIVEKRNELTKLIKNKRKELDKML